MTRNPAARGSLELTWSTYESLKQYMKSMPQANNDTLYYAALPVTKRNAENDVWVTPDGKREPICL